MKILVTGGAGRLGLMLIERLVKNGYNIRVFDLPFVDFSQITGLENVEIVKGDVTNFDHVKNAVRGVDGVFHLAAVLPPGSERNRERTMRVNVSGTENILEAIKEEKKSAPIMVPSSVSVYGTTATESPQSARTIYWLLPTFTLRAR